MTELEWRPQGEFHGSVALSDGHELAVYSWDPTTNHPYFAEVRPREHHGVLTNHAPWDHPWHHGLWWSWKYLDDVLYWENNPAYGGRHAGLGTSRVTRHSTPETRGSTIRIVQSLSWAPADSDQPVLTEQRELTMGLSGGAWYVDWDLIWTARQPVSFTVTPYPDYDWGGYAGLNFRPARSLVAGETIRSGAGGDGRESVHNQLVPWCAYTGRVDGAGTGTPDDPPVGGVVLMSHPENARHPLPGYAFSGGSGDFGFLALAPLMRESLAMEPEEQLRLRFRSLILGRSTSDDELHELYQQYAH